ncbi:hypothetical protein [Arsenicicoccus dermatophilus]|uniref:hypothetical protein n=1 Tax=Arsenicicoccus dermatophilus TaxID=1076331 RepID=UPI003916D272
MVGPVLATAVRAVLVGVWRLAWWCWRHKRHTAALAVAGVVSWLVGGTRLFTLVLLAVAVPSLVGAWWREVDPVGFERWCAGPWRRVRLSWWWRRSWPGMSQVLDLGREHTTTAKDGDQVTVWRPARARVKATSTTLHVRVRVPAGKTAAHVLAQAEAVAAMAGASSVRAEKASPSVAVWHLCMVRVLDTPRPSAPPTSARGPVVLGRREDGTDLTWDPWVDAHIGLQGQTRGGKSHGVQTLLAGLSMRTDVVVTGCDPSGILLGPWCAGRGGAWIATGTRDMTAHAAVLTALVTEMDHRIATLTHAGVDKLTRFTPATPVLVVVLEEYPGLLAAARSDDDTTGRKAGDRITPLIERQVGRLVREGAKVGVRVVVLAQRMSAKTLDTDDRANLPTRITLRCDSTDSIRMLHDGIDVDPADVRAFPPGICLTETPGHPLTRARLDSTTYATYLRRVEDGTHATNTTPSAWQAPALAATHDVTRVSGHVHEPGASLVEGTPKTRRTRNTRPKNTTSTDTVTDTSTTATDEKGEAA